MKLMGPWAAGYVLDYHSVSAVPTGDPYHPFEMKYTGLGDRLYRFKYRNDAGALPDILDTAENFVRGLGLKIDCLVPAPPSKPGGSQPVVQLARELAKASGAFDPRGRRYQDERDAIDEKYSGLAGATEDIGRSRPNWGR